MRSFVCLKCCIFFESKKFDKNREPKYCSKKCFQNRVIKEETKEKMSLSKQGKEPWNKGITMWEGKEHPRGNLGKPSKQKGIKRCQETIQKLKDSHYGKKYPERSGENHHYWKGGITPENEKIRKSSDYSNWRKSIFERDEFKCVLCLKKGGCLNADHIMPFSTHPELRFNLENGRTLCKECHIKTDTYGCKMHKKPTHKNTF